MYLNVTYVYVLNIRTEEVRKHDISCVFPLSESFHYLNGINNLPAIKNLPRVFTCTCIINVKKKTLDVFNHASTASEVS